MEPPAADDAEVNAALIRVGSPRQTRVSLSDGRWCSVSGSSSGPKAWSWSRASGAHAGVIWRFHSWDVYRHGRVYPVVRLLDAVVTAGAAVLSAAPA